MNARDVLISQLLDLAVDTFSTHGYNDFEVLATEENKKILLAMQLNADPTWVTLPVERNGKFITSDCLLMHYFSRVLKGEICLPL